jgi:predicted nucleic acid-binding Zn ribbon protein
MEECESCGDKIEDFKVITVEDDPYIICTKCYKHREELLNYMDKWMRDNKITMNDIEKEVKKQNSKI